MRTDMTSTTTLLGALLAITERAAADASVRRAPSDARTLLSSNTTVISAAVPAFNTSQQPTIPQVYPRHDVNTYVSDLVSGLSALDTFTYAWTVDQSVAPLSAGAGFQSVSVAALSWDAEQGPGGAFWDVCAMALSSTFTPDSAPLANGSCAPAFGRECLGQLDAAIVAGLSSRVDGGGREVREFKCGGTYSLSVPDACDVFDGDTFEFITQEVTPDVASGQPFVMRSVNGTDQSALVAQEQAVVYPLWLVWNSANTTWKDGTVTGSTKLEFVCLQSGNASGDASSWPPTGTSVATGAGVQILPAMASLWTVMALIILVGP